MSPGAAAAIDGSPHLRENGFCAPSPRTMTPLDTATTLLLQRMVDGDTSAAEELLPLVYEELHRVAERCMRNERADHTLQATALVNEAWLRLAVMAV